jgi:hypothetical protein
MDSFSWQYASGSICNAHGVRREGAGGSAMRHWTKAFMVLVPALIMAAPNFAYAQSNCGQPTNVYVCNNCGTGSNDGKMVVIGGGFPQVGALHREVSCSGGCIRGGWVQGGGQDCSPTIVRSATAGPVVIRAQAVAKERQLLMPNCTGGFVPVVFEKPVESATWKPSESLQTQQEIVAVLGN